MAIDPVTASLVLGGIKGLSTAFGGPSDEVRLGRDQFKQGVREYEGREDRRDDALRLASARERAQKMLRANLMGNVGGLRPQQINASSIYADPTNPFAAGGGPGGILGPGVGARPTRSGPDPLAPVSFSDEELGVGDFALPAPEMRGRSAVQRQAVGRDPSIAPLIKGAASLGKAAKGGGLRGRTFGKASAQAQARLDDLLRQRGMI